MQPRIVRVTAAAESFASLIEAAATAGFRVGWLELSEPVPMAPTLEAALAAGALRAVSVGVRRTLSAKERKGPPVLRDIVREHFTGCRLLLVRGAVDAPEMSPDAGGWRLDRVTGQETILSTGDFVDRLRQPSFP